MMDHGWWNIPNCLARLIERTHATFQSKRVRERSERGVSGRSPEDESDGLLVGHGGIAGGRVGVDVESRETFAHGGAVKQIPLQLFGSCDVAFESSMVGMHVLQDARMVLSLDLGHGRSQPEFVVGGTVVGTSHHDSVSGQGNASHLCPDALVEPIAVLGGDAGNLFHGQRVGEVVHVHCLYASFGQLGHEPRFADPGGAINVNNHVFLSITFQKSTRVL